MEEVIKSHAISDGDPFREPGELDSDFDEGFDNEEDEEVETSSVPTSSDDDEGVVGEAVVSVVDEPAGSRPRSRP